MFAGFAAVGPADHHLYETRATVAGHVEKVMESRAIIEQAKGIVMREVATALVAEAATSDT